MKQLLFSVFLLTTFMVSSAVHALPQSVRIDMLGAKLVEQLNAKDYKSALNTMQELKSVSSSLPASFEYFEGKALFESGQQAASYEKFAHYAESQGKQGKYYSETIAYLVKAESAYKTEQKKRIEEENRRQAEARCLKAAREAKVRAEEAARIAREAEQRRVEALARQKAEEEAKKRAEEAARVAEKERREAEERANMQQIYWKRNFSFSGKSEATHIIRTNDGGFVVAGAYYLDEKKNRSVCWAIKLNKDGDISWKRTFDTSVGKRVSRDHVGSLILLKDGGCLLTIHKNSGSWLIKLDALGNTIWEKKPGSWDGIDYLYSTIQSRGGGIVAVAGSHQILKIDLLGNLLWKKMLDNDDDDPRYDEPKVAELADGGYVFMVNRLPRYNFLKPIGYSRVIKLDENGNEIWNHKLKSWWAKHDEYLDGLLPLNNNGFLVTSTRYGKGYVLLFNENGKEIKERELDWYGYRSELINQSKNNGIIIIHLDFPYGSGGLYGSFKELDSPKEIEEHRLPSDTWGGCKIEAFAQTSEGEYILAGVDQAHSACVIRTDSNFKGWFKK